jgi:hypothetical protein
MVFMKRPGSLARRGAPSGLALVIASGLMAGCLVSFDGYQSLEDGGTGDAGAVGASGGAGGKSNLGGKNGGAGKATSGNTSGGSTTDPNGGSGDEPNGGSDVGGNGGAAAGGKSGNAGASMGGKAGSAGAGGRAGAGGSSGTSGAGGVSGAGGGGGSGGAPAKTCPVNLSGPTLIEIPKAGGGIYCMDRTEVPSSDYAAFLATNPNPVFQQSNECTWNDSFQPDTSAACATSLGAYDPGARPHQPVSCIDWCDAKRYCAWAGKRLCGAIAGGANPPGSYIDANASQWFRACSKGGTLKYPYGNIYEATTCVGVDNSGIHPSQVASAPLCVGGYQSLFDMSGNVAEWEDSCSASAGANDACLIRGGSIQDANSTAPSLSCNDSADGDATPSPATAKRSTKDELVGFRCCYDP